MRRKKMALTHRRRAAEAQIEALRAGLLAEQEEFAREERSGQRLEEQIEANRKAISERRGIRGVETVLK